MNELIPMSVEMKYITYISGSFPRAQYIIQLWMFLLNFNELSNKLDVSLAKFHENLLTGVEDN